MGSAIAFMLGVLVGIVGTCVFIVVIEEDNRL